MGEKSKIYYNDVIEEVIFKITFFNQINPEDKISEFYEYISDKFKFQKTKSEPEISINITNQEGKINTVSKPVAWYFYELENLDASPFILEITKNHVLLDFRAYLMRYPGFNELMNYINMVINAISVYGLNEAKILGLRYINKINCKKGNPLKWDGIISSDLLNSKLLTNVESPSRFLSNIGFRKNDFSIHFAYGIFNKEFPNPISRKEFVLDFDCLSFDNNFNEMPKTITKMHDTIGELFNEYKGPKIEKFMMED